jgi:hypothetical protein
VNPVDETVAWVLAMELSKAILKDFIENILSRVAAGSPSNNALFLPSTLA